MLTLQKCHERVGCVGGWKIVPARRVEFVSGVAPVHWKTVDSVCHEIYCGASGNEVPSQPVICNGLPHSHWDGGNVSQRLFADIL